MKKSNLYIGIILVLLLFGVVCLYRPCAYSVIRKGYADAAVAKEWGPLIAYQTNINGVILSVDGNIWKSKEPVYMNSDRILMVPVTAVRELFRCNAAVYDEQTLKVYQGTKSIQAELSDSYVQIGEEKIEYVTPFIREEDSYYVSAEVLADGLDYTLAWDDDTGILQLTDNTQGGLRLPMAYDGRTLGRVPLVKDQGNLGTCWAFAAISSLEARLLPAENISFSVDHMSLNNAFGISQEVGGEYTMAMSYLLSWKGPVYEKDDPYGDGKTNSELAAVKHVQEIQILPKKDLTAIKEAVYLYGGVQTSLYSALSDFSGVSEYYNQDNSAYFYVGTQKVNHDVVIVGWDDNYPKENFNTLPEGNGAFLCMNSWGKAFGEKGFFWVSYFDSNVGIYNIVYTGIEETDNYDWVYQSDLCGWVGQLGYGQETAYFANVYTAKDEEWLEAVGFYAVGRNTEYQVSVIRDFEDEQELSKGTVVASGSFSNAGYYTVPLDKHVGLKQGERFAVCVYIRTPGEKRPIAVEYNSEEDGVYVKLSDGEGYISLKGTSWKSAEYTQNCNLCLKAYTKYCSKAQFQRES